MSLIAFSTVNSQHKTLQDVLPLEVGNKWTYNYYNESHPLYIHVWSGYTGTKSYQIIGTDVFNDSTIWRFKVTSVLKDFSSSYGSGSYVTKIFYFNLVEFNKGNHELYTPDYNVESIFPFKANLADSNKFYRHQLIEQSKISDKTIWLTNLEFLRIGYKYSADRDSGLVSLLSFSSSGGSSTSWQHTLTEFINPGSGAILSLDNKPITLATPFGSVKDSTLTFRNMGDSDLIITEITSSNSVFAVTDFSKVVPSLEYGFIKIHYNPNFADTTFGLLEIKSNSLATNNKINLTGRSYGAAELLSTSSINCGVIENGKISFTTYTIKNIGNIPLKIDRITIENDGAFTSKLKKINIDPNKTIIDTIFFSPTTSYSHNALLTIYSNASNAPQRIYLWGESYEPANVDVTPLLINFGTVNAREKKESEIHITNKGNDPITVEYYLKSESFTLFSLNWNYGTHELQSQETYNLVVGFNPTNANAITDTVKITLFKPYIFVLAKISVALRGNYSTKLFQNFPNPFNNTTTIKYQVEEQGYVKIKLFNTLGREIGTIVNEQKPPGNYIVNLNSEGLSSGIYFYRIECGSYSETKKIVLLK